MTKAAVSPLNTVLLRIIPVRMAASIPIIYSEKTTIPARLPKNAEAISPYTGSLAEQLIKGMSIMVRRLSFSFSIVRAPITAGTVHPKPMSIGIKAFPDRPKFRSSLSIIKAPLAM